MWEAKCYIILIVCWKETNQLARGERGIFLAQDYAGETFEQTLHEAAEGAAEDIDVSVALGQQEEGDSLFNGKGSLSVPFPVVW